MIDLTGRVALVTGASRGIGRAIALALAEAGASVAVNYRESAEAAEAVCSDIEAAGRPALAMQADVRDLDAVSAMVKQVTNELGGLHILVNNAGVVADQYVAFMKPEQWDEVVDTSLKGAFNCTKAAVRGMMREKWGRIVSISSDAGLMGDVRRVNYSAAKAGLVGFTKAAARELASQGITVNAVAPGIIETDMTADMKGDFKESVLAQIPLRRFGHPEEVAYPICFLLTEAASYINGATIHINGGGLRL